jgi:hypothetical protein
MKTLGFCLFIAILSSNGICQEIPKGANLVTFESASLNNFDLFKECVLILKDEGYLFDQLDKDFYMCSTKPIEPKKMNLAYRLDISVTNNKLTIRSFVRLLDNFISKKEYSFERGANKGLSSSIWRYGWNMQVHLLEKIKSKFPGNVYYSVE